MTTKELTQREVLARKAEVVMTGDVHPMRNRTTMLNEVLVRCPCCRQADGFKSTYSYKPQLGVRLLSTTQNCHCKIDDETKDRFIARAVREHHEGQLI